MSDYSDRPIVDSAALRAALVRRGALVPGDETTTMITAPIADWPTLTIERRPDEPRGKRARGAASVRCNLLPNVVAK